MRDLRATFKTDILDLDERMAIVRERMNAYRASAGESAELAKRAQIAEVGVSLQRVFMKTPTSGNSRQDEGEPPPTSGNSRQDGGSGESCPEVPARVPGK